MKTLKNVLLINALSSGATGIGLVLFASPIKQFFAAENSVPFIGVGIFLTAFAIFVFRESRRITLNLKMVRVIIILDSSWVAVSFIVIVLQLFNLSALGYIVIGAVALWVAAMAYLQNNATKHITSANL